jgi:hypothetical protein
MHPTQAKLRGLLGALLVAAALCGTSARMDGARAPKLKVYSNARYGIRFQYPSSYMVREGRLPRADAGLGYMGPIPMGFAGPGGLRLVTLESPGAYPGTDFVNAFFTVSVNRHLTRKECGDFRLPDPQTFQDIAGTTISGIPFSGVEGGGTAMSHSVDATFYHGFSKGICYELGYGVATAGWAGEDGLKSFPPDVYVILKSMFHTIRIHPPNQPNGAHKAHVKSGRALGRLGPAKSPLTPLPHLSKAV